MKLKSFLLFLFSITFLVTNYVISQQRHNSIQISAPVNTETSGKIGVVANQSVMRVICSRTQMGGTGFLHKSGWIITAAHVISECPKQSILLLTVDGQQIKVDSIVSDLFYDLALIKPMTEINAPTLNLSKKSEIKVGAMVTTWGFPSGYNSLSPLLTVGYLSGADQIPTSNGLSPRRWVVNAAFNGGNSGGPVLDIENGEVIGVVSSKLAPIPPFIESALAALENQPSGFSYSKSMPDGTTQSVSEGQLIAEILKYLRSQTQLVLGHAVTSIDLIQFLKKHNISE